MVNGTSERTADEAAEVGDRAGAGTEEPLPDLAARVLRRFRLVFNAVKAHFQQVEKRAGIGGAQLWALSVIAARPGIGVGGLADAMDIHQSTASNLVRALVEREYVCTSRDGEDRRAVRLTVAGAGKRILERAPGPLTGVLPRALACLDHRTLARLDRDLDRLIAELEADERAANIPLGEIVGERTGAPGRGAQGSAERRTPQPGKQRPRPARAEKARAGPSAGSR